MMKLRTGFVTNSSSSSFILIGDSLEDIIGIVKEYKLFGDIHDAIVKRLSTAKVLNGDELKMYYEQDILFILNCAREAVMNALCSDDPFEWMYDTDMAHYVTREVGTLRKEELVNNVAVIINLDSEDDGEYFGWQSSGYHLSKNGEKGIFIIGINGH